MNYSTEILSWTQEVLFVIGILLIPIGIGFMLIPEKISKVANKLNKWVATDAFFTKLNAPVYKERFFYRHHRIFGVLVFLLSLVCLYMMTFYAGTDSTTENLLKVAESEFEKWLFVVLYYLLIGAIFLSLLFGLIMFIRPSALKSFESWGNHWVDTDDSLKVLDKNKDLFEWILPRNQRIFGLFVILGAIYIIWSTSSV